MVWALFRLQDLGSPFLLCDICQAFRGMGKSFKLYAFRQTYGLERAHGPCFRLLLLPDQYHWCNSKVQTLCSITLYPNLPTGISPVPHSAELPVPKPPPNMTLSDSESSDEDVGQANKNMACDPTFTGDCSSNEPHLLSQGNLNYIFRDLNLSKQQDELLGSRLKGFNLLRQDIKVCFYRGRHEEFKDFFSQEDGVVFCNDVCSVMEVLGHEFNPDQWRLFIGWSKVTWGRLSLWKSVWLTNYHPCSAEIREDPGS